MKLYEKRTFAEFGDPHGADWGQQSLDALLGHLESLCEREEERIGEGRTGPLGDRIALVQEACEAIGVAFGGSPKAIREMADRLKNQGVDRPREGMPTVNWRRRPKALVQLKPGDRVKLFDVRAGVNGRSATVESVYPPKLYEKPEDRSVGVRIDGLTGSEYRHVLKRSQMRKLAGRTAMMLSKELES